MAEESDRLVTEDDIEREFFPVYVIQDTYILAAFELNQIKIGRSASPHARVERFRTGSPCDLMLLGVINGDCESALHDKFEPDRIYRRGGKTEWFNISASVQRWLIRQFATTWSITLYLYARRDPVGFRKAVDEALKFLRANGDRIPLATLLKIDSNGNCVLRREKEGFEHLDLDSLLCDDFELRPVMSQEADHGTPST